MVAGSIGALATYVLYKTGVLPFGSDLAEAFWGAINAFCLDAVVSVGVTFVTEPKPVEELEGLVYGMAAAEERLTAAERVWYRSPKVLGFAVLGLTVLASVFFI
jgi:solute:Na+ symporter, SSS family